MNKTTRRRTVSWQSTFITAILGIALAMPASVLADPPPWAPAHGYKNKSKHKHKHKKQHKRHKKQKHYQEQEHHHDVYVREVYGYEVPELGVFQGRCNRETVGAVLGGVVGGVVGSQIGEGDGKTVATIAGTLLGVVVGGHVGRSMDDADRYCTGQALEQASDGQPVAWRNPDTGSDYQVTPLSTFKQGDRHCREYRTDATIGTAPRSSHRIACRTHDGSWEIQ